jgi:hypothetical protein
MKAPMGFIATLALVTIVHVHGSQSTATPVGKVIKLLQGMLAKGKQEKHEEELEFASTRQFCEDEEGTKESTIEEEVQTMGSLESGIQKDGSDATTLTRKIAGLETDIETWTADTKAATKVRDIQKADYIASIKTYEESIEALRKAIASIKTGKQKSKASFTQLERLQNLDLIPAAAKRTIDAFLQQSADATAALDLLAAPEAAAYEFQGHGIVDMLQKLMDKFIDEQTAAQKAEANQMSAHAMLVDDLEDEISEAGKDKTGKAVTKSSKLEAKADKSGDLKAESAQNKVDDKSLKDLKASCSMKKADFDARQQLRSEEFASIDKAIEVLSGNSVLLAEKYAPALVQSSSATAFNQLRSNSNSNVIKDRVVQFLKTQSAKFHSRVLEKVAEHASQDPLAKVKKMIKDMVVRLIEEANEEAGHKGWCDTELSTNAQTREAKTAAVDGLHADIDQLQSSISKLTQDILELSKSAAELQAAMTKSTTIRSQEKATNKQTVTDSQDARAALAQALSVMRDFYARAAEATSLLQQQPYQGQQGANKGVVAMLEVIESDFARLESDTGAAEASAQKQYDEFMTDTKADKASKSAALDHKTAKKQDESQSLSAKTSDLEGTQKELDAALAYFDKLKPSCVDSGTDYDERVERRKDEIESLQEALKVMAGEDLA